jgi:hypothetical protein
MSAIIGLAWEKEFGLSKEQLKREKEPHGCINYSQGGDRCPKQCNKCKQLES